MAEPEVAEPEMAEPEMLVLSSSQSAQGTHKLT